MPQTDVFEPMTVEAGSYSYEMSYDDYLTIQKVDKDDDGTYDYVEIVECDTSATEIEIPSEIDGLHVESIGYRAFSYCKNLTSITIPDSVIEVGG
ncbi:MAG: leucine-rich repeat protein, partial [Oscillospiraceae bacterium]|nr:leucine-rich repeat protein [Oscillospiraceae bacterium]